MSQSIKKNKTVKIKDDDFIQPPTTTSIDENDEYNKKVKHFFEIKSKWESIKTKKNAKCLICNNATKTMTFEIGRNHYLAKCGKKGCPKIEIDRKVYISIDERIEEMQNKLNTLKRKFIIEKMDAMFKFIDDKNAVKVFKDEFEEYRELLKVYNQYNLDDKKTEVEKKINELNGKVYNECIEIKKMRQEESPNIEDIINIVTNKITPLTDELQKIKYPIMEMNILKNGDIQLYQKGEKMQFIEKL